MKGKSARHGRAPSPYQKHGKTPYRYSPGYYAWKRTKVASIARSGKYADEAQQALRQQSNRSRRLKVKALGS